MTEHHQPTPESAEHVSDINVVDIGQGIDKKEGSVSAADGVPSDSEIEAIARQHGTGGWQTLNDMIRFGRAVLALSATKPQPFGNAGELKTDDQMGFVLAAIQHYGSQKWAEGKGLAPTDLLNVREAWDAVYTSVQALAAQAQPPVSQTHKYAPHKQWPMHCDVCGYAESEPLQHGELKNG